MKGRNMERKTDYSPKLGLRETERGIKLIKDAFERHIATALNLQRVSAPKFLEYGNGLQDDLAGTQQPVGFSVKHTPNPVEMVHSLAKWKRWVLARYGFGLGEGLYTDMDAIRKDEVVDEIHSNYVDQWDWERIISAEDRNLDFLKDIVGRIYNTLLEVEEIVATKFPVLNRRLPDRIEFIHCQDLEDRYPDLSPEEREYQTAEEYGAFFLRGIGARLRSGKVHDPRAADYDDWITEVEPGRPGLNGDIIVFDQTGGRALELSSMGIRVDKSSLVAQLKEMGQEERLQMAFHQGIINDEIPLTVGGGIGQSRICMLLLQKYHVGEVQVSVWPKSMRDSCEARGIPLL
jgi:aspartate--ammonia ligase